MTLDITGVDFFCGAGGTTIGAVRAGVRMRAAANHWPRAIETHNTNFPNVDHYLGDISKARMRTFPKADILFASPECTTHSPAGGKRPKRTLFDPNPAGMEELERSRATMWDVTRYAELHTPRAVIVENVIEIMRWHEWNGWLRAMHKLGYEHRSVFLNSMIAWPTPQSRDRIYVVFWRKGNRAPNLDIRPQCWCVKCATVVGGIQSWKNPARPYGKYRTQYVYRCPSCNSVAYPYAYAAATAIDWALPTPRIGDRGRPLADKTLARIRAGLERYGPRAIVAAAGNTWERHPGVRTWPITDPLMTQATTAQHALVVDTTFPGAGHIRPATDPLAAQSTRAAHALVVSMTTNGRAFQADAEPLRTTVAKCSTQALVVPLRTNGTAFPAENSPLRAMVAGNAGHAIVVPMRQHTQPTSTGDPMPTMLASQVGGALLVPAGGTWNDEARPLSDPMRARTSRESEGLFVFRNNEGAILTSASEPFGTMTTKGTQAIVAEPFLVPYFGTGVAHGVSETMGTVDTRDRRALVQPSVDVDDCGFRMLEPHEIGRAMAFPDDYKVLGNKRERVRQYGNALTPPASTLLTQRVVESLSGREV